MDMVVATRNQDKLREIKALLRSMPVKVVSLNNFKNVPKVIEDGKTLEANAKKKAIHVSRFLKRLALADDSGLEVPFLKNKPGVYSARFSGKGATYASNNSKLLNMLRHVRGVGRTANFRCVIAIVDKGKIIDVVEGICKGSIGLEPAGRSGFGYDPVFIPRGYKKTFAQMGLREKNKISHRSKALIKAKRVIKRYILTFQDAADKIIGH